MGEVSDEIIRSIRRRLDPEHVEISDESDIHRGHPGHDGRGESHFRLLVVSGQFRGRGRTERHRMVHDSLSGELWSRIHALSVKALSPEEYCGTKKIDLK